MKFFKMRVLSFIGILTIFFCNTSSNTEQILALTNNSEATLGIALRYKIFIPPNRPNTIIVIFARSYGNLKISIDKGVSWKNFYDYKTLIKWRDFHAKTIVPYLDYHSVIEGNSETIFITFPDYTDKKQKFIKYDFINDVIFKPFPLKDNEPNHHKRGTLLFDGKSIWIFTRTSKGSDVNWQGNIRYHHSKDKGNSWYSSSSDIGYVDKLDQDTRIGALMWDRKPTLIVWLGRDFKYKYYYWNGKTWFSPKGAEFSIEDKHPLTRQFAAIAYNGNLHIVWQDKINGVLKEAWKKFNEKSWHQQVVEINEGNDNFLPILTKRGKYIYLFYSYIEKNGKRNIYGRVKFNNRWSNRFKVSSSGNNCRHPNVPRSVISKLNFIPIIWTEGQRAPYKICFKKILVK